MSTAESGFIHNSSQCFTIAIDQCDLKGLRGVIYHGRYSYGIVFNSLVELIKNINFILDDIKSLKQSVELRKFKNIEKEHHQNSATEIEKGGIRHGKSGTFQLTFRSRYHASWQGTCTWMEGGIATQFDSFLSLIVYINQFLGGKGDLAEDNESSSPKPSMQLCDVILLLERMEGLVCQSEFVLGAEGTFIDQVSSQMFCANYKNNKKVTFLVKVLFNKQSTWQGNICWRETCEQLNFRSFLEMLMLMDSAMKNGYELEPVDDISYGYTRI